jgi:DNA-binding NtrC family response regulator
MANHSAIILSTDEVTISVFAEGAREMEMTSVHKNDFPGLLLEIQECDYSVILCDCSNSFKKCLQLVKIIKKMRPKVPLIVIGNEIDKQTGGKLYQEGIFHLCEKPINKDYIKEVLSATSNPFKSHENINKFKNL